MTRPICKLCTFRHSPNVPCASPKADAFTGPSASDLARKRPNNRKAKGWKAVKRPDGRT